jgi:hypothetical protein
VSDHEHGDNYCAYCHGRDMGIRRAATIEEVLARRIEFARSLADPDWCLSVPNQAKDVIRDFLAAVEAVLAEHKRIVLSGAGPVCARGADWIEEDPRSHDWPCPTVTAITAALTNQGPTTDQEVSSL